MSDYDNGMARAQAAYDRMEDPRQDGEGETSEEEIMPAPFEVIYLQWEGPEFAESEYPAEPGVSCTWCQDKINDTDTEYCRITAEELAALRSRIERLERERDAARLRGDAWKAYADHVDICPQCIYGECCELGVELYAQAQGYEAAALLQKPEEER